MRRGRCCRPPNGARWKRWKNSAAATIPASAATPMPSRARARRLRTWRRKRSLPCCAPCRTFAARTRASSRAGFSASPATASTAKRGASAPAPSPRALTRPTPRLCRASASNRPSAARAFCGRWTASTPNRGRWWRSATIWNFLRADRRGAGNESRARQVALARRAGKAAQTAGGRGKLRADGGKGSAAAVL